MVRPSAPSLQATRRRIRGRRLLRGQRGIAAVIGTLLALLVFMTLFGIFITEFLPLWMTDNEASEANAVEAQLGQVKTCMDLLALEGTRGETCSTPVPLEAQGVPIFAQPTQGTLSFQPFSPQLYTNVSFNETALGPPKPHANAWQNQSPSEIDLNLPDRYYVPVKYSLTMGGLFSSQGGGSTQNMLFQPEWLETQQGTATNLSIVFYVMYGNSTSQSSLPTDEIYVSFYSENTYTGSATNVQVNMTTFYPCGWTNYLHTAFRGPGLLSPVVTPSTCPSTIIPGRYYPMHILFPSVSYFSLTVVYFDVEMGISNPT